MVLHVQLRRVDKENLTFAEDNDKERITKILEIDLPVGKILGTKRFGTPIRFNWEDTGKFDEQLDEEIKRRGGNPEEVNAYLPIGEEKVIRERGEGLVGEEWVRIPKMFQQPISLYRIPEEDAEKQRAYIWGFVSAWSR